jgi:hypothetical protein
MDPNGNLTEQAFILTQQSPATDGISTQHKRRLRELREALQDWLNHGGFEPSWVSHPTATREFKTWQRKRRKFQDLYR